MQIGYVGRGNMGGALAQRLACELASARGVPTRFGDLARDNDAMCINELGATAEVDTAALVMDRLSGMHVVPPASALE